MTTKLPIDYSARKQKVVEGVNTLLSLFSTVKQQRLFPRKIMTKVTKVQVTVYSVEEILKRFKEADYKDCRINAYPAFLNIAEEKDYENGVNLDFFIPNILFMDLDLKDFSSKKELDKVVNKILVNISKTLYYFKPLLLWSGRGHHIIIPVKVTEALEHFEEFDAFTKRPSEEFLQFAKEYLSFNKADKANTPAFKSCLLRVPNTFNSKCFDEGKDPEVKMIQEFDYTKPLPEIDNLLVEFMTFLTDRKLKKEMEMEKMKKYNNIQKSNIISSSTIPYVEKLLELGLSDYRKNAINLILTPYFVNILKLSDEESFYRIKQWVLKCNDEESLKPSIGDFDILIKNAINRAKITGIKPLKFKDTLQYKNKKLYNIILSSLYK